MAIETGRIFDAARAYADAARNVTERAESIQQAAPPSLPGAPAPEFAAVLRDSVQEAVAVKRHAEEQSMLAVAGKADLAEVVTAVANAELTLQTVVSIRDRMVQAYQDIIRMPI